MMNEQVCYKGLKISGKILHVKKSHKFNTPTILITQNK